jgi:hypothetical protein
VTIRVRLAAAFTLLVAAILVLVGVVTYQTAAPEFAG